MTINYDGANSEEISDRMHLISDGKNAPLFGQLGDVAVAIGKYALNEKLNEKYKDELALFKLSISDAKNYLGYLEKPNQALSFKSLDEIKKIKTYSLLAKDPENTENVRTTFNQLTNIIDKVLSNYEVKNAEETDIFINVSKGLFSFSKLMNYNKIPAKTHGLDPDSLVSGNL